MNSDGKSTGAITCNLGIAFLAVASGSSDVIAFLTLGHVFAAAMTGNTALLGIALSEGDLVAASQPITALLGFVFGAAIAAVVFDPNASSARQSGTLRSLMLLEIVCLGSFAIVWQLGDHANQSLAHYGLILLCSVGMGVQGIAARVINAPGVNTIVFTSTVVAIVLSMTEILLGRQDGSSIRSSTKRQIAIFAAYGAGAVIAGLLDWNAFTLLVWMPVTAALLALVCFEIAGARSRAA